MRCRFCGGTSVHPDTQHKTFSAGKAIVGAAAVGGIGAAAGFIGKEKKGYRCSQCGAFMESVMDFSTEIGINSAIRDAENGRSTHMYEYYKRQYCNIHANIPVQKTNDNIRYVEQSITSIPVQVPEESNEVLKHTYYNENWDPNCPVFVHSIIIKTKGDKDYLSLEARNIGKSVIRSIYYDVIVFDDTGDELCRKQIVYQNLSVGNKEMLPVEKEFSLDTDLAYRVSITCVKIAMQDDTIWRKDEKAALEKIEPQIQLDKSNFPKYKYLKKSLEGISEVAEKEQFYMPVLKNNYWSCVCGQPVKIGETCPYCNAEYDTLTERMSQQQLSVLQRQVVKEKATERANKTQALYKKAEDLFNKKKAEEEAEERARLEKERLEQEKARIEHEEALDKQYQEALALKDSKKIGELQAAIDSFTDLGDWKDSAQKKEEFEKILNERVIINEEKNKKNKKIALIVTAVIIALAVIFLIVTKVVIPNNNYNKAVALMEAEEYEQAALAFEAMGDYKDSVQMAENAREAALEVKKAEDYQKACEYMAAENYSEALALFNELEDYKDSKKYAEEAGKIVAYDEGITYLNNEKYEAAITAFKTADNYKDAKEKLALAEKKLKEQQKEEKYLYAISLLSSDSNKSENNVKAKEIFDELGKYKDSKKYSSQIVKTLIKYESGNDIYVFLNYDEKGHVVGINSKPSDFKDVKVKYDEKGRINKVKSEDSIYATSGTFSYDSNDRIVKADLSYGTYTREYDISSKGRISKRVQSNGSKKETATYKYSKENGCQVVTIQNKVPVNSYFITTYDTLYYDKDGCLVKTVFNSDKREIVHNYTYAYIWFSKNDPDEELYQDYLIQFKYF